MAPKPPAQEAICNPWVLESTQIIVNMRVYMRQDNTQDKQLLHCLGFQIMAILWVGHCQWVEACVMDI